METEIIKSNDLTGQVVGNYHITERLGRGGMADVYKALHSGLQVHRAIKFIRPELVTSEDFRARFQNEAQAVARLEHPNIVRIHDFGHVDNQYFMVMQFIEGHDLKRQLAESGPLAVEQAIDLVCAIAGALSYAHDRDLIHRDIKPENIMLGKNDTPILMDFGVAKLLTETTALTQTGVGIGTPAYMAPEQAQGMTVTPATDIYALSVVLYELLTGEQPYSADTPIAVMLKAINDPLPLPRSINPDISEALQAVIIKGTAKEPEQRYASAKLLVNDLQAVRQGKTPVATTQIQSAAIDNAAAMAQTKLRSSPTARPQRLPRWPFALVALAGLAALGWWWLDSKNPGQSSQPSAVSLAEQTDQSDPEPPTAAVPQVPTSSAASAASGDARSAATKEESAAARSTSAPTSAPTSTMANDPSPVQGTLFAYRDTLPAGEEVVTQVELNKGESIYLQVHSSDATADYTLHAPDERSTVFKRNGDFGPLTLKTSGIHRFQIKTRKEIDNAIDVELVKLSPLTIDGGELIPGQYTAGATAQPGQRVGYTVDLNQGDWVYFDFEQSDATTDFQLRSLDDRKNLFSSYADNGPHEIADTGTYQFYADPRSDKLSHYEFRLHRLNPAVIDGGSYPLNQWQTGETQQPGQLVDYRLNLNEGDTVYFELEKASSTTDFMLQVDGARKPLFKSYASGGPYEVLDSGAYRLRVDPRGDKLSHFEFQLHKLDPAVIEGGAIGLDQEIFASTTQPGQRVVWTLELAQSANLRLQVNQTDSTTDFALRRSNSRKDLFKSYASTRNAVNVPAGIYDFSADPRGSGLGSISVELVTE